MNSEKLKENLNTIDSNINENAVEYISNSIRCLEKIEDYGEVYKEKLSELKSIYYELQETARDISSLKDDADFDEYERDEVERRLDIITSLKRKYGNSIEEILEYKDKLKAEQNEEQLEESKLKSAKINENVQEAISGLMVLGYSKKDIEKAFEHLTVETLSVEELIRKGLILLSK